MNIAFYNDLSYGQLICLYTFSGAAIMYSSFYLLRKIWPSMIIQEVDSDIISGLHAAIFTITFLTLGYCLTNASETIDQYQQNVTKEASEIQSLDNLLLMYEKKEANLLRQELFEYSKSITTQEWPLLASRTGSPSTEAIQKNLRSHIAKLNPTSGKELVIYSEMLETMNKIVQARLTRINNSKGSLTPQFMLTSNIGFLCVLIISALMLTQFTWFRFISLNIQIVAVSFIFATTIVLDHPFRGSDQISAEPIEIVNNSIKSSL